MLYLLKIRPSSLNFLSSLYQPPKCSNPKFVRTSPLQLSSLNSSPIPSTHRTLLSWPRLDLFPVLPPPLSPLLESTKETLNPSTFLDPSPDFLPKVQSIRVDPSILTRVPQSQEESREDPSETLPVSRGRLDNFKERDINVEKMF